MLNPLAVLDRFGDEEFLRELWLKARGQLPAELNAAEELRTQEPSPEMAKRLHRLRGLIANFLEGGDSLVALRECEEVCRRNGEIPETSWAVFRSSLKKEAAELEGWLNERGFPCP